MKTILVLLSAVTKDPPNWPAIVPFVIVVLVFGVFYEDWQRSFFQIPPEKPE